MRNLMLDRVDLHMRRSIHEEWDIRNWAIPSLREAK
jgi:hypothetical protein